MTLKELANRFIATQRANWRNPEATLKCYTDWLGRLLAGKGEVMQIELSKAEYRTLLGVLEKAPGVLAYAGI